MPIIVSQPLPELIDVSNQEANFEDTRQFLQNVGAVTNKRAIQSFNYSPGVSGLKINFETGVAEFVTLVSGSFIKTFAQASIPTSENIGDIWIDTDDDNNTYRAASVGATTIAVGAWEFVGSASEWADILDGAGTKPDNNATLGATFGTDISGGGSGDGQVSDGGYVSGLNVSKLIAGTITSKIITLAVSAGTGDSVIKAGKTDFGDDANSGFILGIDDSDSDLAKFEIGNESDYLKWTGSKLSMVCSGVNAITIEYGSDILLKHGGDIKFTSVIAPTACTASLITAAGNVDAEQHSYAITFVNDTGETELGTSSNTVTNDGSNEQNLLTGIPVSTSGSVTARKIYRRRITTGDYFLLATINDNTTTTYTDNTANIDLTKEWANNKVNDSFGKIIIDDLVCGDIGSTNIFIGASVGYNNTVGYNNVAIGHKAFEDNTTGYSNVALGNDSLENNLSGNFNIGIGDNAAYNNKTGNHNISLGYLSMAQCRSGEQNIAIGRSAMNSNYTGDNNIGIGYSALYSNNPTRGFISAFEDYGSTVAGTVKVTDTGHGLVGVVSNIKISNTLNGTYDAVETITVIDNDNFYITAIWNGPSTGYWSKDLEGIYNLAIGYRAGFSNIVGSDNVFIGKLAGFYETGSDKLYISNSNTTVPLIYGEFDNNNIGFNQKTFGGGVGVMCIGNASTIPTSNPTTSGILYVENGALKFRGSSGTITTIANA